MLGFQSCRGVLTAGLRRGGSPAVMVGAGTARQAVVAIKSCVLKFRNASNYCWII